MAVTWLILCVNVIKLKMGRLFAIVILVVTLGVYIPLYKTTYITDRDNNRNCENTVTQMHKLINTSDVILTNGIHLNWTILEYYFPDVNHVSADIGYSKFNSDTKYWLVWTTELTDDEANWLNSFSYRVEERMHDAYLGTNGFHLYELIKE